MERCHSIFATVLITLLIGCADETSDNSSDDKHNDMSTREDDGTEEVTKTPNTDDVDSQESDTDGTTLNTIENSPKDGVDILVVVDNSSSMAEEQQILSSAFFTLINTLVEPLDNAQIELQPIENVRVAVVSSDLGLQFGADRETNSSILIDSCEDLKGDDGAFLPVPASVTTIRIPSGVIACDTDSSQCPNEFYCSGDPAEDMWKSPTYSAKTATFIPFVTVIGLQQWNRSA